MSDATDTKKDLESKGVIKKQGNQNKIAVILIRGIIKVSGDKKETLKRLGLLKINNMVILSDKKETLGMIKKVKDYVTWGIIDEATLAMLKSKRKPIAERGSKLIFTLNPPRKGFERRGIKTPFSLGGALGDRKEKINTLIKRMI